MSPACLAWHRLAPPIEALTDAEHGGAVGLESPGSPRELAAPLPAGSQLVTIGGEWRSTGRCLWSCVPGAHG